MGDEDRTLMKRKQELDRDAAADRLESLARQIRAGAIEVDEADGVLRRDVPERVHLDEEVKDSPKDAGVKREFELELWWLSDPE